jgi:hypothetical protein
MLMMMGSPGRGDTDSHEAFGRDVARPVEY